MRFTKTLKFRLIVTTILCAAAVSLFSNLYIYRYLNGIIQQRSQSINENNLNALALLLNDYLADVTELGILCANDTAVVNALEQRDFSPASMRLALSAQTQLNAYDNTSSNSSSVPQIYNNTFYLSGADHSTVLFGGKSARTCFINFRNNIVLAENGAELAFTHTDSSIHADSLIENNCFWPATVDTSVFTTDQLTASGNLFTDPQLTDPAAGLNYTDFELAAADRAAIYGLAEKRVAELCEPYQPKTGSPVIRAGQIIDGAPEKDILGNSVVGLIDIGAIEVSSTPEENAAIEPIVMATPVGKQPELPATVTVTIDGAGYRFPVTWDAITADSLAQAGTLQIGGSIRGISAKASATVHVVAQAAGFESVAVDTWVNVYPELPDTVTANFDGGLQLKLDAVWSIMDDTDLQSPGVKTLRGTVPALPGAPEVTATVNVRGSATTRTEPVKEGASGDAYIQRSNGGTAYGNWYHWEITAPTALMNTCMVLYNELTADQLARYTKATQWYVPYCDKGGPNSNGPKMTGGNLLLKANGVAQCGILMQDASMLDNVKAGVKTTLSYNDPSQFYTSDADGFYADGSYIQHQALAYIGGYGADLYNNLGVFLTVLNGSDWAISYEDGSEKVAYDFVFNGIEPFIYEGHTMDMISSRDVTRSNHNDHERTGRILEAILPLRGSFPTAEQNLRFDAMVKYLLSQDSDFYFAQMDSITSIMEGVELLADAGIAPRGSYTLTKTFTMDKTVHLTGDFGFAISMHSDRTYGHELINNEGKQTWNTSDGMYYLYDADVNKYADGYWATVDPTRLPGTTAEHIVFNNGVGDRTKNVYSWVGGTALGSSGVSGMHLRTLGSVSSSTRSGTDAYKSWFLFGDRIVAVGSGITSTTGNTVETVIDNAKLKEDGSNIITIDGTAALLTDTAAVITPEWMHLEGNVAGSQTGYWIPNGQKVTVLKEARTGDWTSQGTTTGTAVNTFATFWFDHGTNPSGAGYEYVLLPGKTAAQTAAWAAAPDVEILENTTALHAARDIANGVTAANFWQAGTSADLGASVDAPASLLLQRTGDMLEIALSDPTQKDAVIELTLAVAGTVTASDANITVLQESPFVKLSVNTARMGGQSSYATVRVDADVATEVVAVTGSFDAFETELGTAFKLLDLPDTVEVLANDGKTYEVGIKWDRTGYDRMNSGTYTLTGDLVMPEGLANTAGCTVTIDVTVGQTRQDAEMDTLVRAGSYADDVIAGAASGTGIALKLDADVSYVRSGLLRVSLKSLPQTFEKAYLNLTTGDPDTGFTGADLYRVSNDWTDTTVTYNTRPARKDETPAASFTAADAAGHQLKLDVTEAVRAAIAEGEDAVSFEIVITGTPGSKNQITISTIEAADAAARPYLSWDQSLVSEYVDKENLRMLVACANSLDPDAFSNYDAAVMEATVAQAVAVLEDDRVDMVDVHDAEDILAAALLDLRYVPTVIS